MPTEKTLSADIGLVGLAVMGENLALNIESRGYTVAVYNRTASRTRTFISGRGAGRRFIPAETPEALVAAIKRPRKILLMVKAGEPVQSMVDALTPILEAGDMIIDGGNSDYRDTEARTRQAENRGLLFVGTGISGGEEGALKGPAIMPGGSSGAWEAIRPMFEAVAAKADDGAPCCAWMGARGAGHFVKMVHNGIEYGDMQLICESYHLMRDLLQLEAGRMATVFEQWNHGDLESYLIEITGKILGVAEADGTPLVDRILDAAGQKGTGNWTVEAALDLSVPLTLIGEAVFARHLSARKAERVEASRVLKGPEPSFKESPSAFLLDLEHGLMASKIISYAQGFTLMRMASEAYGWGLDLESIALIWRNGCIIRSGFLDRIADACRQDPKRTSLLTAPFFMDKIHRAQQGWRRVVAAGAVNGFPLPAMGAGLAYYDGFRTERLPANLLQAQRDFFGAHTYERTDRPRGKFFHTKWE